MNEQYDNLDTAVSAAAALSPAALIEAAHNAQDMNGIKSSTPVADALAEVDASQGNDLESERRLAWVRSAGMAATALELTALRALAEAVRASLIAFDEGDVRTLAAVAWELYYEFDPGDLLSEQQNETVGKAYNLFVRGAS
jgi:hypothetical protein